MPDNPGKKPGAVRRRGRKASQPVVVREARIQLSQSTGTNINKQQVVPEQQPAGHQQREHLQQQQQQQKQQQQNQQQRQHQEQQQRQHQYSQQPLQQHLRQQQLLHQQQHFQPIPQYDVQQQHFQPIPQYDVQQQHQQQQQQLLHQHLQPLQQNNLQQQQQQQQQLLHQHLQPLQQNNLQQQQQLLHQHLQPLQQNNLQQQQQQQLVYQPLQQFQQPVYVRVGPAVPQGVALPPKPPIPPTNDRYELKNIAGNISKCCGCGNTFKSSGVCPPDNAVVICRKERDYYPHVNDDGSKSWHFGRAQNKHYHLSSDCIL